MTLAGVGVAHGGQDRLAEITARHEAVKDWREGFADPPDSDFTSDWWHRCRVCGATVPILSEIKHADSCPVPDMLRKQVADIDWLVGDVARLREIEADWNRVREELMNAKGAVANITDRLNLKLDELSEQDGEVARLRGLLGRLEWAGEEGARQYCPTCTAYESSGHARDCWLAAEIATTPHA